MARNVEVLIFLTLIGIEALAAPQYHHNGYHPTSNAGMDYMKDFYQMPRMQHQQDYQAYPYSQSVFKQQEMPYQMPYSEMTHQIMQKIPDSMHYQHHQVPVGLNEHPHSDTLQGYDKSQPEMHYGGEMFTGQLPTMSQYTNQISSLLKPSEENKQSYSPASSVSHVKFNGMGTMYEWGSN